MNRTLLKFLPFLLIFLASCTKDEIIEPVNETRVYLHISHTRTNTNPFMNSIVEKVDFSKFDMLWLGGDLARSTSENDYSMYHIDSIYDVGNENTLWALGNHDYFNLTNIQNYTNRPPFYSYYKNKITFIVLDTQDSLSNIVGAQKKFFEETIDTIQKTTHLIILHHKLIWMYANPELEPLIPTVSNGEFGDCFYCLNPNGFYTEIYPKLLEVKQRRIEVICIGGDIGFHTKEFEYYTSDGIVFLASGINAGSSYNEALLFKHNLINDSLSWEYKPITEL